MTISLLKLSSSLLIALLCLGCRFPGDVIPSSKHDGPPPAIIKEKFFNTIEPGRSSLNQVTNILGEPAFIFDEDRVYIYRVELINNKIVNLGTTYHGFIKIRWMPYTFKSRDSRCYCVVVELDRNNIITEMEVLFEK